MQFASAKCLSMSQLNPIFTLNFASVTQKFPHSYKYRSRPDFEFTFREFDPKLIKTPNVFKYDSFGITNRVAFKREVISTKDDLKYTRIMIDNNINLREIKSLSDWGLLHDWSEYSTFIESKFVNDALGLKTPIDNHTPTLERDFYITKMIYDTTVADLMYLFGYKNEEEWNTGEQANIPYTIIDIKNVIETKILNTDTYSQKIVKWWKDHPFYWIFYSGYSNDYTMNELFKRQFTYIIPFYIYKYRYDFELLTPAEKKILRSDYTKHTNDVNPLVIIRTMIYEEYHHRIQEVLYDEEYTGIKVGLPTNFVDISEFIVHKILTSNRYNETTLEWWKIALDEIKNIGKDEKYIRGILAFLINKY